MKKRILIVPLLIIISVLTISQVTGIEEDNLVGWCNLLDYTEDCAKLGTNLYLRCSDRKQINLDTCLNIYHSTCVENELRCTGNVLEGCESGKWVTDTNCAIVGDICDATQTIPTCIPSLTYADMLTLADSSFHKWKYKSGSCIIYYPASSASEAEPVLSYGGITSVGNTFYYTWEIQGTPNSIMSSCGAW